MTVFSDAYDAWMAAASVPVTYQAVAGGAPVATRAVLFCDAPAVNLFAVGVRAVGWRGYVRTTAITPREGDQFLMTDGFRIQVKHAHLDVGRGLWEMDLDRALTPIVVPGPGILTGRYLPSLIMGPPRRAA